MDFLSRREYSSKELYRKLTRKVNSLKILEEEIGKLKKEKPKPNLSFRPGQARAGEGSESQEQEWHFHKLRPSDIHRKPE